jgi:hypothetical protein
VYQDGDSGHPFHLVVELSDPTVEALGYGNLRNAFAGVHAGVRTPLTLTFAVF